MSRQYAATSGSHRSRCRRIATTQISRWRFSTLASKHSATTATPPRLHVGLDLASCRFRDAVSHHRFGSLQELAVDDHCQREGVLGSVVVPEFKGDLRASA